MNKRLFFTYGILISFSFLFGCSSSTAINDFFGIEMPPSEVDYFKIVGYTETSGISYQSTRNMNPDLYAWAGLEGTNIRIKITNNSDEPIETNYEIDQYLLVEKEGNEFILNKGSKIEYTNFDPIEPHSSIELVLELPKDYWKTVGAKQNPDYMKAFTREQSTLVFNKEKTKSIQIKLGYTKTIILKPVTEITK